MKTKTLSILFALVMVLSMSVGVFAQDPFAETWDENTVLTVFSDMDMVFPDLFADDDSDFLFVDGPESFPGGFTTKDSNDKLIAKAPVDGADENPLAAIPYTELDGVEFTYDPCGDGLIKFTVPLDRETIAQYVADHPFPEYLNPFSTEKYGPEKVTYIRNIEAYLTLPDGTIIEATLKKCNAPDDCHKIIWKKDGTAKLTGYLYAPVVMEFEDSGDIDVEMYIEVSNYMTALWDVPTEYVVATGSAYANTKSKNNYCQPSLTVYSVPGTVAGGNLNGVRAVYDENTGEARFQATIRNFAEDFSIDPMTGKTKAPKQNYVIPADVITYYDITEDPTTGDWITWESKRITDYTCKYTIYNNANGAPRTDYCKFGEGIALPTNAIIRFDITIDHLSSTVLKDWDGGDGFFYFRVGGMTGFVPGVFKPVDFPCPKVSRMQVMDPLHDFLFFKDMISDSAIKASGPYGVYEGGLWGMYQKCGKYAWMAVRLKNDGLKTEKVNLDHVSVAINGGTPMSWHWMLSSVEPYKNIVELETGDDVLLFGRAKVTDIPSQLNADTAMTGAINFTDFGFYITGKVYSDHNNTNCVAAPK
jgi:hypothetical protein